MPLISLRGKPRRLGTKNGALHTCPSSPNCVCSDDGVRGKIVEPFRLQIDAAKAWSIVKQSVGAMPRTRIVTASDDYLHAECTSALLGFVDDLELHLRVDDEMIAVRSASRLGYSDLGVNRRRVERLRKILMDRNVVA